MAYYLCLYHDDGRNEHRPLNNPEPKITCQACRAYGYFSQEQVREYERTHFRRFAVYRRECVGFPETLHVLLAPGDTEEYAKKIAPLGSWRFLHVHYGDYAALADENTRTLNKPAPGHTLEDTRSEWDKAPPSCW